MMGWGSQGGYGMGGFGGILMILFWVAVIVVVVLLFRQILHSQGTGSSAPRDQPPRDPLEILRERYARGEIGTEEFEERRKVLEKRD